MSYFIMRITGLSSKEWETNREILYDMSDKKIYLYRLCDVTFIIFRLISPKSKDAVIKKLNSKFIEGQFISKELFEAIVLQCHRFQKPNLELLSLDYLNNFSDILFD